MNLYNYLIYNDLQMLACNLTHILCVTAMKECHCNKEVQ